MCSLHVSARGDLAALGALWERFTGPFFMLVLLVSFVRGMVGDTPTNSMVVCVCPCCEPCCPCGCIRSRRIHLGGRTRSHELLRATSRELLPVCLQPQCLSPLVFRSRHVARVAAGNHALAVSHVLSPGLGRGQALPLLRQAHCVAMTSPSLASGHVRLWLTPSHFSSDGSWCDIDLSGSCQVPAQWCAATEAWSSSRGRMAVRLRSRWTHPQAVTSRT